MDNKHCCEPKSIPTKMFGVAVNHCNEDDDGALWVSNDEYANQVNYCPFCGFKAKIEVIFEKNGD